MHCIDLLSEFRGFSGARTVGARDRPTSQRARASARRTAGCSSIWNRGKATDLRRDREDTLLRSISFYRAPDATSSYILIPSLPRLPILDRLPAPPVLSRPMSRRKGNPRGLPASAAGISRRELLRGAGALGLGMMVAGCGESTVDAPVTVDTSADTRADCSAARIAAAPKAARGDRRPATDRPHRRRDDGEPLVRQLLRDARSGRRVPTRQERRPLDANPDGNGTAVRAFHMPSTCQLDKASQPQLERSPDLPERRQERRLRARQRSGRDGLLDQGGSPLLRRARRGPSRSPIAGSRRSPRRRIPNRRFLIAGTAHGHSSHDISGSEPAPERRRSSTASTRTGSRGATTTPASRRPASTPARAPNRTRS